MEMYYQMGKQESLAPLINNIQYHQEKSGKKLNYKDKWI